VEAGEEGGGIVLGAHRRLVARWALSGAAGLGGSNDEAPAPSRAIGGDEGPRPYAGDVGVDDRRLDPASRYRFELRLELGSPARVDQYVTSGMMAASVREAGVHIAERAAAVAAVLDRLDGLGWRPAEDPPAGREVLPAHGFTAPQGPVLPEYVCVVREATAADVARDLQQVRGRLGDELERSLAVRFEGLDIPVRVGPEGGQLRYSPREYLETFSIRG
jgi:hypothetical protein